MFNQTTKPHWPLEHWPYIPLRHFIKQLYNILKSTTKSVFDQIAILPQSTLPNPPQFSYIGWSQKLNQTMKFKQRLAHKLEKQSRKNKQTHTSGEMTKETMVAVDGAADGDGGSGLIAPLSRNKAVGLSPPASRKRSSAVGNLVIWSFTWDARVFYLL